MNFANELFTDYFFACGFLRNKLPTKIEYSGVDKAIFDVSSLTKALVTAPQVFDFFKKNNLDLKKSFLDLGLLKSFPSNLRHLNPHECLRHESGLPAWKNFFTQSENKRRSILEVFSGIKVKPKKPLYSDLGYILLSQIKEIKFQNQSCIDSSRAVSMGYSAVRQRELKGEVHDDNAFAIQGFAGHSGAFFTGHEVISKLQKIFFEDEYSGFFSANQELISANLGNESLLGLRQGGDDSAKVFFGGKTMGHYGFTGCAFWVEPKTSAYVVLLTNRVAKSFAIQKNWKEFRQQVFTYAYQTLEKLTPEKSS